MTDKKIAILLDFDGPLFNNDLVKKEICLRFNLTEEQWNTAYNHSKKGKLYVDYGNIFKELAEITRISPNHDTEQDLWSMFYDSVLTSSNLKSPENQQALKELLKLGRVELITQGHKEYQWLKLLRSETQNIIIQANENQLDGNPPHSIEVIPEDKIGFLKQRLEVLNKEEYEVIQIDDRVEPLIEVKKFANESGITNLHQIRIFTGKYTKDKSPEGCGWPDMPNLSSAVRHIEQTILNNRGIEGGHSMSDRMRR